MTNPASQDRPVAGLSRRGLLGLALTPDESALLAYYTVEESSLALCSFSPRRNQPRGRLTSSAAAWHCAAERSA